MLYSDHFQLADDYFSHLDTVISGISDPFIKAKYTGFAAVSGVTVYELALKEIFINFAHRKHKVLENFTLSYFDKINGRITRQNIEEDYLPKFGEKYLKRYKKLTQKKEKEILISERTSIKWCYGNIIAWRNEFVHEGRIPANATYEEVFKSFQCGKHMLHCLSQAMTR